MQKKPSDEKRTNRLIEIFYPPHCAFCGSVMKPEYLQICSDCAQKLPEPPAVRRGDFYKVCVSALPYDDLVRKAVLRLKMGAKRTCAETFGRMMAAQIREKLKGQYDLITWVPVSGLRRIRRGFDQDQLIAFAIADALSMPMKKLLKKWPFTRTQSRMPDAAHRRANVLNAFKTINEREIAGKCILLIDDVITTGATLSECSRVLRLAGASEVVCATFAATNRSR